jgi:import inner membrane translocase subunit TIM22
LKGFVLGIGLGVFTASIDPMSTIHTTTPGATPTLKDVWREMRTRSMSYAKNFAIVGLVFSTVECNIESV